MYESLSCISQPVPGLTGWEFLLRRLALGIWAVRGCRWELCA
ncbi:hypothetical protein [Kamptonema formosum]|nr:hypothetical protein [Oscillatoria sp. PCC 10802]